MAEDFEGNESLDDAEAGSSCTSGDPPTPPTSGMTDSPHRSAR